MSWEFKSVKSKLWAMECLSPVTLIWGIRLSTIIYCQVDIIGTELSFIKYFYYTNIFILADSCSVAKLEKIAAVELINS